MRVDGTWSLPTSPTELRVRALDVDARRCALSAEGSRGVRLTLADRDELAVVRIEREVPTGARGAAVAVVGRFLPMVQTEEWAPADLDDTVRANLRVVFPGRPITVAGRIEITVTATGSVYRIAGRVDAGAPVIGPLLERRIATQMLADLEHQLEADEPRRVSRP